MLSIERIAACLGAFQLGPINLRIARGEHRLIVGPSGAGKSLLLRVVAGFHAASSGTCRVGEREVTHAPPAARRCVWVGQRAALFPHLSVRENIAFGLHPRNFPPAAREDRVQLLAARVQVDTLLNRRPAQLSAGQQQRVALARALAPGFDVLLLDEPFSALDRGARTDMVRLLDALCAELLLTILHVTHDVGLLRETTLPSSAMVDGRIVQEGPLASMFATSEPALREALGPREFSLRGASPL